MELKNSMTWLFICIISYLDLDLDLGFFLKSMNSLAKTSKGSAFFLCIQKASISILLKITLFHSKISWHWLNVGIREWYMCTEAFLKYSIIFFSRRGLTFFLVPTASFSVDKIPLYSKVEGEGEQFGKEESQQVQLGIWVLLQRVLSEGVPQIPGVGWLGLQVAL